MKKLVTLVCGALLVLAPVAQAYSIKHSYRGAGNSTEYHGMCANGTQMVMVEQPNGDWKYEGPAGDGTLSNGDLDKVARKACGE